MFVDFESLRQVRKPTKSEAALYRRWVVYLSNSRLTEDDIHRRALMFTQQKKRVPNDV
jgi:hypothetical protein